MIQIRRTLSVQGNMVRAIILTDASCRSRDVQALTVPAFTPTYP